MRFDYQYRTQDNVCHHDVIDAVSREAAFSILKAHGIKPFGLVESAGFANRLRALGKRGWTIVVLSSALLVLVVALVLLRERPIALDLMARSPRHQIYGDPALLNEITRDGFAKVFAHPGDAFLARYAEPGECHLGGVAANVAISEDTFAALRECLKSEIVTKAEDPREVAEYKAIVRGMKDELREYLGDGVGTPKSYVRRLNERLNEERQIRSRVLTELESDSSEPAVRRANETLRAYGLRTIAAPANQ